VIKGYYDNITVGDAVETKGRTVTEADIVNFAGISGDFHPLHLDSVHAEAGPFGRRIAHGLLVLSIATGLAPLDPDTVLAFYGIDRLRFLRPAYIGDTISVRSEVIGLVERNAASGVVVSAMTVRNQDRADLLAGQIRMLVSRRPS
jgi:acyl dehydratase